MSKSNGLGDALFVGGYDLSGDIGSLSKIGGGPAALTVTGINKSAMERLGGLVDGDIAYTAYWNPGPEANAAHKRLSLLPRTDQYLTYCHTTLIGGPAAAMIGKQIGYDGTRGDDGAFTLAVDTQGNGYGLEWGRQLTAGIRTDTTATLGGTVDLGAGTPPEFGLQAYLQVHGFTGTSVTVKLQESSDGTTFTDVTGGTFAAATAIGSQRIQTARDQTVQRYLRASTTGTFTSAKISVVAVRNLVEVVF